MWDEKQKNVEFLVKNLFSNKDHIKRCVFDLLQCITGAFLFIMPYRLSKNKHPFFSQEKSIERTRADECTTKGFDVGKNKVRD